MHERVRSITDLEIEVRGPAAIFTLNRPRQLNALTLDMVRALHAALDEIAVDPAITRVILRGAGDKAFCAGGDIRALHDFGRQGNLVESRRFWREEYLLNTDLQAYPKPIVSLIDGIVMGGGVGLSIHGSHRVAGDKTVFAMPEVSIGFFPDVGATYPLARLPGAIGAYLAVTGERIGPADTLALRLATHRVATKDQSAVLDALCSSAAVEDVLESFAAAPEPAPLAAHRDVIDGAFAAPTVAAILARLDEMSDTSEFARATAALMRKKSPTSMAIALEQIRRAQTLSFRQVMAMDFRIVCRIGEGHDFYEGVRAVIIDKDHAPRWQPAKVEDLNPAAIGAYFAPLGADELFGPEPAAGLH
jgi:enoyl-CoA hydratase